MAQAISGSHWPLEETNGNARAFPKRKTTLGSQSSGKSGQRELKSNSWRPNEAYSSVQSDSEDVKQRRASVKKSNAVNAASVSRKRSRNAVRDSSREKREPRVDDSAWIHRDKLAQIEIQEMEDAGIHVRQSRRSLSAGPGASARSSRSQSRTRRPISKDQQGVEDSHGGAHPSYDEFERKRISTIPAADEDELDFDPKTDAEFRSPGEVAAVHEPVRPPSSALRPSTSRIPVSKASPVPVPSNVVDRDSPLPRSSGAWSGNWDEMQYARRARSNSIGSQVMLENEGVQTPPRPGSSQKLSSTESSPPKSRVPNKSTPTSGARKDSTNGGRPNSGSTKPTPRTASGSQRPLSRSGHKSRPSTSHQQAPEGEAPWIAGMYKPDPRLPQDQQMLPTHAKRMQQEQWEKEGKTGTAFDRDFRLLNDDQFPQKKPKPSDLQLSRAESEGTSPKLEVPNGGSTNVMNMDAWPLTPKSPGRSSPGASPSRPGTSGGYRITPTISTPPAPPTKSPSFRNGSVQGEPHRPTPRVPDMDEKEEPQPKKGGCGCCIIM